MRIDRLWIMSAVAAVMTLAVGCGASKERCTVGLKYTLKPTEQIPEGLTTVAVNESEVEATEAGTDDADRAKKWSRMAADMMEDMIIRANKEHSTGLTVAKRRETKDIMKEADLQAAGLTQESAQAGQPPQLAEVQGLIKSRLTIRNEVKVGKSKTTKINIGALATGSWGSAADQEEVEDVSRNMTVQCSFSMYDKAGNPLFQYSPPPFRKFDEEKPGAVMGGSKTEAELDSADAIIGELVDQGVREFVGMFIPCPVEYRYELESSRHESSAMAVRQFRADNYEEAIKDFQVAVSEDPDDHRSLFGLGLAFEKTGRFDEAISAYKRALACPGLDDHETAKYKAVADRLAAQKDRIIRS